MSSLLGSPNSTRHFCGRPVVCLMSSLLLAVGRATFVWWAGGAFNVVFAQRAQLYTSVPAGGAWSGHFCGQLVVRLMSS